MTSTWVMNGLRRLCRRLSSRECLKYRFHFAVHLFDDRSPTMTSKCGKNKKVAFYPHVLNTMTSVVDINYGNSIGLRSQM